MTRRAYLAFGSMSLIWGVPYLMVKVAVDDGISPGFLSFARVAVGFVFLFPVCRRAGLLGAARGRMRSIVAYAVFEIVLPMPLGAFGEQHISSSLTAIVVAASPLFVVVLAARFAGERVSRSRVCGLGVGFAGVVALVGVDLGGSGALLGSGAVLVVALSYALAPLIFDRRLLDVDPRATTWATLGVSSVMLAPAAAAKPPTEMPGTAAMLAIAGLAVTCALGLVVYGVLVKEAGPSRALVVTYVNPLVAVGLGVATLGERVSAPMLAGLAFVLLGSWLSTGGGLRISCRRIRLRSRLAALSA